MPVPFRRTGQSMISRLEHHGHDHVRRLTDEQSPQLRPAVGIVEQVHVQERHAGVQLIERRPPAVVVRQHNALVAALVHGVGQRGARTFPPAFSAGSRTTRQEVSS
jgi:hypothetical protein